MAYEEIIENVGFGLAQVKPETESITYDTSSQGYTSRFTHVAFALGFMISEEAQRDNQYAKIGHRRARDLGFSMRTTHEIVAADKWNTAFTANGGDGVPAILRQPSDRGRPAVEPRSRQPTSARRAWRMRRLRRGRSRTRAES